MLVIPVTYLWELLANIEKKEESIHLKNAIELEPEVAK